MRNFKKAVALTLATSLVASSSVAVFATAPKTSDSSTGTGTSEGHVDTHVINVILPTIAEGSTPFAYTMDTERLIQATNGDKHQGATFPAAASDTGVYFLTGGAAAGESYTAATPKDPSSEGWYETSDGTTYTVSADTLIDSTKTYYSKTEAVYTQVSAEEVTDNIGGDASAIPWYEYDGSNYTVSTNTNILGSETFYTQTTPESYDPVADTAEDPSALGWYEEDSANAGTYVQTTDTSVTAGKVYYVKSTSSGSATYANESEALTVRSESSDDVELTVEVAASTADTDIKLVNAAPASTVTDAELYLGLKVGSEAAVAIKAGETVSKKVTIAGIAGNFETIVNAQGQYEYAPKADATGWGEVDFSIEGAASKASAKGLTAPTLTVTWKYVDPDAAEEDAAPELTEENTTYVVAKDKAQDVGISLGSGDLKATGISEITYLNASKQKKTLVAGTDYTVADGKLTIAAGAVNTFVGGSANTRQYTVVFNDDAETTVTFTFSKS